MHANQNKAFQYSKCQLKKSTWFFTFSLFLVFSNLFMLRRVLSSLILKQCNATQQTRAHTNIVTSDLVWHINVSRCNRGLSFNNKLYRWKYLKLCQSLRLCASVCEPVCICGSVCLSLSVSLSAFITYLSVFFCFPRLFSTINTEGTEVEKSDSSSSCLVH